MQKVPVILFDSAFWQPLVDFIHNTLDEKLHTISPEDCEIFRVIDDEEEIVHIVNEFRKKTEKKHIERIEETTRPSAA